MFQNGICAQYIVRHDVKLPAELSSVKMCEEVQTSERNVEKHTSNLQKKGIIRRIGPKNGGHWKIINNK